MDRSILIAITVVCAMAISTGIAGLVILPPTWSEASASVVTLSGIVLFVAGYAISRR